MLHELMNGIKAMVLGMGMVYVFLLIMIVLMTIMSKLLAPFAGMLEKPVAAPKTKKKAAPKSGAMSAQDVVLAKAAITAVKLHRGEAK